MLAINILDRIKQTTVSSIKTETKSSKYTHAGDDECPVCKTVMKKAKIKDEDVLFCPTHRISFPVKE